MNFRKTIAVVGLFLGVSCVTGVSFAGEKNNKVKKSVIRAEVVTGLNISKGEVLYDLGGDLGGANFDFVFAHEPDMLEASVITQDTDENVLLATGYDPDFANLLGLDVSTVPSDALNVPLRDVPITVDPFAGTRIKLDPISSDNFNLGPALSSPSTPITLRDWYKAQGLAKVKCIGNTASVTMAFKGLVPNGLYTLWGIFGTDANDDGAIDGVAAIPFGGVPNVMTASSRGRSVFERILPFCPDESVDLLLVDVVYHADGAANGGQPALYPSVNLNFPGLASSPAHLTFNMSNLAPAE